MTIRLDRLWRWVERPLLGVLILLWAAFLPVAATEAHASWLSILVAAVPWLVMAVTLVHVIRYTHRRAIRRTVEVLHRRAAAQAASDLAGKVAGVPGKQADQS